MMGMPLLLRVGLLIEASIRAVAFVVPLHFDEGHTSKSKSLNLVSISSGSRSWLEYQRAKHNNTHAIEYYGYISVGNQSFRILFDTGSDSLILPGKECISPACKTHHVYDATKSKTAVNMSTSIARDCKFGAGSVMGYEKEDRVCLGEACANANFVEALIESDDPFMHANFDGVLGLSLALRKNATAKNSVLETLAAAKVIPSAVFAVFLSKNLHSQNSELSFGEWNSDRMAGTPIWAPLSDPGYWQISLQSIRVGGKEIQACATESANLQNKTMVSSFFGKMCCRTLEEFEWEDRCQFWGNASDTDDDGNVLFRSRFTDTAMVVSTFDDGRVAVRLHDGCLQKVPRKWIAMNDGCRGDGTIQAVLDTGSSLMMAPEQMAARILSAMGVKENCTSQDTDKFPSLTLALESGEVLTLTAADYMDTVVEKEGVFCWPHLIPMPDTAKGPVLVLGMPFLRTYYTAFDAENHRVGFVTPNQPTAEAKPISKHISHSAVKLRGTRPGETEAELSVDVHNH